MVEVAPELLLGYGRVVIQKRAAVFTHTSTYGEAGMYSSGVCRFRAVARRDTPTTDGSIFFLAYMRLLARLSDAPHVPSET